MFLYGESVTIFSDREIFHSDKPEESIHYQPWKADRYFQLPQDVHYFPFNFFIL